MHDITRYNSINQSTTLLIKVSNFQHATSGTLLSQKRHRLDASCGFCQQVVSSLPTSSCICEHQTCCNLIFADLPQVNETTCIKPACSSQLATNLLTTCNRLVIIKPEQAMRTHPDIGLVIVDLLFLAV